MAFPGKFLISLVALATSTGCYIADWNETHIYNPTWPPHAKFHNGQTMSMGALLGICTLWYLWAPIAMGAETRAKDKIPLAARRDAELERLRTAVLFGALYWVTQASAYVYPGTDAFDPIPGLDTRDRSAQLKLDVVLLSMLSLGWWLEWRRIKWRRTD
ncbi:Alpha beta-hydrolase [Mycena sanguinolenta]|uniref:Alpha beta-hydrolase n=1 Tax=Mycena sanguinolenta TaxID=230812 RepID=A0A8H6XJR6_9AGAR|nr:Alpha beta-hydrolase [Mycena sanguinolenta]